MPKDNISPPESQPFSPLDPINISMNIVGDYIAEDDIFLEVECSNCEGKGFIDISEVQQTVKYQSNPKKYMDDWGLICPDCCGKGVLITKEGKIILDLVRRHLQPSSVNTGE